MAERKEFDQDVYLIHESRLSTLQKRIHNLNKKMSGGGQIVYSILGKTQDKYIDKNGIERTGTYYQVNVDGAVKFKNMELLGQISFLNKDSDESSFKTYTSNILEEDAAFLEKSHGRTCDCCNKERKRNDLYAFKCNKDTDGPNGVKFKAGHYYQIGTSCVDEFMGKEARQAIEGLTGQLDARVKVREKVGSPVFYDAELLTKYILVVGVLRIDEAYNYYKNNPSVSVDDLGNKYNIPKSYRGCKSSVNHVMSYGYCDGSILRTAKALYCLNELDPNVYNYDSMFESPRLSDDKDLDIIRNSKVLAKICDNFGFNKSFRSGDIDKLQKKIFEIDNVKELCKKLNNRDCMIAANKEAVEHVDLIRSSYCQLLVDICDEYLLKQGKYFCHEEEKPLFKQHKRLDGGYYYKDNNGRYVNVFNDTYDSVYAGVCALNSYKNSRILEIKSRFNEIPDEEIPVRIRDNAERVFNAYQHANNSEEAQAARSRMQETSERVAQESINGDNNKTVYDYSYRIMSVSDKCIKPLPGKSGWSIVGITVPKYVSENEYVNIECKNTQIMQYQSSKSQKSFNAVVADVNYAPTCTIVKNGETTKRKFTLDKIAEWHSKNQRTYHYQQAKRRNNQAQSRGHEFDGTMRQNTAEMFFD